MLAAWLAVPYSLSVLALAATGITVVMPWRYLLPFAGIAVPYAYCLARGLKAAARPLDRRPRLRPVAGAVMGVAALAALPQLGHGHLAVLAAFYGLLILDVRRLPAGYFQGLTAALGSLVLGLGTVCNLNYLLAPRVAAGLNDAALMRLDLSLYRLLLSPPVEPRGLFPLVSDATAFRLLESAYHIVFAELFLVVLALLWTRRDASGFLRAVFLAYFAGLVVFALYPAVGPCIHYPETFRPEFHSTATHYLMRKMAVEWAAATAKMPVNGLAYFVAVPSLHAALATLCQCFLRGTGVVFWTFLPVNVTVVLSTVLLGYHYLVDVPLGVLLGLAAAWNVTSQPWICLPTVAAVRRAWPRWSPAA
jgi:membrane-associated phospholipid phosphatase